MDFWNIGLSMVIPILQLAVKDAKTRAKIKKAALKIAALINAAYANDDDFDPTGATMRAKVGGLVGAKARKAK